MTRKPLAWRLCVATTIVLCILSYTSRIIPSGVSTPTLWGLPRTLWLGLLVYLAIVAVTFVATRVHPDLDDEEGDDA